MLHPRANWRFNFEGLMENVHIDRIIGMETYAQLLKLFTPRELVVIALRYEGLSNLEVAAELGLSKAAVSMRLDTARKRVLREMPELAPAVEGRSASRGRTCRRQRRKS